MVVRASTKPIQVEVDERSGKVSLKVSKWPAQPDGVFFCSTLNEADLKRGLPGFAKRVKDAVARRRRDQGLEKGRLVGLQRNDPIRHRDDLVAIMHLHLGLNDPPMIIRVDLCEDYMSHTQAQIYRRYLLACAEAIAKELPWGNGRVEWKVHSGDEEKVIQGLGRFQTRPTTGRRQVILFRDPR